VGIALNSDEEIFVCVACGDRVIDLDMLVHAGALGSDEVIDAAHDALHMGSTNLLMDNPAVWPALRARVQQWLLDGAPGGQQARRLREKAAVPMSEVVMVEPCVIGNYTDFYASVDHARTVGSMFRPDNPLLPNYKHVPIGYHGRASSVVASGKEITRPRGQTMPEGASAPVFGLSKRLDFELEVGLIVGKHNEMGVPIDMAKVDDHIFGLVLVNDWSARDIQAWEYQPLGPFLSKSFATTISPWIVTRQALAPFRIAGPQREAGDPQPLEYLRGGPDWGLDLELEVTLRSDQMAGSDMPGVVICRGNFRRMYWTLAQMLVHHASNGCPMMPGDLLASGTVSGPTEESRGCLLERTWAGMGADGKPLPRKAIELPTGEKRIFLEDGDEVSIRGWMQRDGLRIGFGTCSGVIEP
jgi:fumarylacetoacetase